MAIGFSDGTSYEDMHDYYLGQPHSKLQAPDRTVQDEEADPFGNKVKGKDQGRVPQGPYDPSQPRTSSLTSEGQDPQESFGRRVRQIKQDTLPSTRPSSDPEKPTGEFNIDRGHNVPLIASALTKDGSTMHGLAVDHRVNLAMNFEGKQHDITPFLWAHEQAELGPMSDAIKGGMDAKDAYELAHDKVANPAEAAVRNSYAIKAGLDVDKFNEAYWSHINTQKDIAAQPSDKERHPDAHTTRYGLDPKLAMSSEDEKELAGRPRFQVEMGGGGVGIKTGRQVMPAANENKNLQLETPEPDVSKGPFNYKLQSIDAWLKQAQEFLKLSPYEEAVEKQQSGVRKEKQKYDELQKQLDKLERQAKRTKLGIHEVLPQSRPAADQLRDWFKPDK